jgi:hypothetical protein
VIADFLARVWASDELLAVILAAGLSAIGWFLLWLFTPRGKITWSVSHQHAFGLHSLQPPTVVYTREIWIQNVGRAIVEDVEVILNFAPSNFDIWPRRQFTTEITPNGNLVLKFDHLNRREYFTISLFHMAVFPPDITNVAGGAALAAKGQWLRCRFYPCGYADSCSYCC